MIKTRLKFLAISGIGTLKTKTESLKIIEDGKKMKKLLHDFFNELGLPNHAIYVRDSKHKFVLKNYMQIFEVEIYREERIVSKLRASEMQQQYLEAKWEMQHGSYH